MNNELGWKINSAEKKEQLQKGIIVIGPLLTGLAFIFLTERQGVKEAIHEALFIAIIFIFAFLVNMIFPYKDRAYSLDDNGITVSKGKRNKRYLWSDFECFYPYSEGRGFKPNLRLRSLDIEEKRKEIFEAGKGIEGEIFYLKKNPKGIVSKLHKVFVVVYSEINNQGEVNRFLSNKLPRKTMEDTTDLGMVSYEFK
ncbi:MAG: hypothetical protein NTZ84_03215 [Candidatus Nealsonbacteria bacterium]|nr:hypothetical protein [Candidatus Nealsonbacteria bacterium]